VTGVVGEDGSGAGPGKAKAKILLVDDRPENLVALEAALRPLGQDLVLANSGPEALRWLLNDEFAAILLDVQMPGMDGFETAAEIKQRDRSRHVPIIFLTAINRELHQQLRGYEVGAVDYISKPFDPWVLRSKVNVFVDLYEKTRQIQDQAAQLSRSNKELEQFAEVVSHDLRNPLVSVVGYLQMLEEGSPAPLPEAAVPYIKRALHSAEAMGSLIDDLLSYALAGKAIGPMRSTDSGKAVERAISNLNAEIQEAHAQIGHGQLPVVRADSSQLTRLFQNLIGNSVKYRHPNRRLAVDVDAERSPDGWMFSVRDNGLGLAGDEVAALFTMFQRGSGAEGRPGSGIGLAICKKVVEGHGGRIWAEEAGGGGTVVHFTLPTITRS
jgi:signal transduction histidine kinase